MTTRTPEIFGSSIVVVGTFNPAIFTPDWLERNKLIGQDDADAARLHFPIVISQDVCQFETDWFALQSFQDRFSLTSKGPLTPALKDLSVSIFTLLAHTPVTAVGLNFIGHYKLDGQDEYHKIGDILAPKKIWENLCPGENKSYGLAELTIIIQPYSRNEIQKNGDAKKITVQPSSRIKGYGVCFSLNDHHTVSVKDEFTTAEQAAQIIDIDWQRTCEESIRIFDGAISMALEA